MKKKKKNNIGEFFVVYNGGYMLESGLLIALSLILFLMLIGIVGNVYSWIEKKFEDVLLFFTQ